MAQRGQVVADVVEHQVGGVAAALVCEHIAVTLDAHVHRIGVAEQIVDVAQRQPPRWCASLGEPGDEQAARCPRSLATSPCQR